jgi:hypothetical protein
MDKFDLNALGVSEMSETEMETSMGGMLPFVNWIANLLLCGIVYDIINDSSGCYSAMSSGWESGFNY